MIADSFSNWDRYKQGTQWALIKEFIDSFTIDTELGRYDFEGEDLFAFVSEYETKPRSEAVLEAHKKYVDVQFLLAGEERLEWSRPDGLTLKTPYCAENDIMFYEHPEQPEGHVTLKPGIFAMLLPEEDIHSPQGMSGATPQLVKKVVVKIHRGLLGL